MGKYNVKVECFTLDTHTYAHTHTHTYTHTQTCKPVEDLGEGGGHAPPWPVKYSHKKMAAKHGGFYFMFLGPLSEVSGSATAHSHTYTHTYTHTPTYIHIYIQHSVKPFLMSKLQCGDSRDYSFCNKSELFHIMKSECNAMLFQNSILHC